MCASKSRIFCSCMFSCWCCKIWALSQKAATFHCSSEKTLQRVWEGRSRKRWMSDVNLLHRHRYCSSNCCFCTDSSARPQHAFCTLSTNVHSVNDKKVLQCAECQWRQLMMSRHLYNPDNKLSKHLSQTVFNSDFDSVLVKTSSADHQLVINDTLALNKNQIKRKTARRVKTLESSLVFDLPGGKCQKHLLFVTIVDIISVFQEKNCGWTGRTEECEHQRAAVGCLSGTSSDPTEPRTLTFTLTLTL